MTVVVVIVTRRRHRATVVSSHSQPTNRFPHPHPALLCSHQVYYPSPSGYPVLYFAPLARVVPSPRRREAIRNDAPLSSLVNLPNVVLLDDDDTVKGTFTAEDLRERARRMKREEQEAQKRAKRAHKKREYNAEALHKRDALVRRRAMEDLNKEAAKAFFNKNNKGRTDGMVDLHGLYVNEALEYAKQALQSAILRNDKVVRFIVGKGLHAKDGKVKIRPALEKYCKEMLGYLSLNVDANKLHVGDVSALHTEFVLCSIFYPSTAWYYYGRGDAVARRVRSSMTIVYMRDLPVRNRFKRECHLPPSPSLAPRASRCSNVQAAPPGPASAPRPASTPLAPACWVDALHAASAPLTLRAVSMPPASAHWVSVPRSARCAAAPSPSPCTRACIIRVDL
ncbi:hypothetical protein BJV77DRAFT_961647 [Russula vinacea]|nr:hypothetical protein BJV77DRAFT_961647 [Russula vinacea]